jgi:hypothetical protein
MSLGIVVLGQSLNPDGNPPPTLLSRIETAATAWRESHTTSPPTIILSGGDPANTGKSEAKIMEELLLLRGVPQEFIILEEKSQNTIQNAHFCLPLLQNLGVDQIILVTSDFHLPRASYLFEAYFSFKQVQVDQMLMPAKTPPPRENDVGINAMPLVDRLHMEKRFLLNYVVQSFLPRHIPGVSIPPLSTDRMDFAIDLVDKMIASS